MDETGAHYTEWSKSERKTPIQYNSAYIWNLERWWWWPYMRDSKRHRCREQISGLCGRRWGWDDVREQHRNMYITICETDRQPKLHAWDRALRAGALGWPWGMGWGGRWEGGSWWGHMYTHGWFMSTCQCMTKPQYCKVISLQLK